MSQSQAVSISKWLTYEARRERSWRTVTESRLLGVLRWSARTAEAFEYGFNVGTLRLLEHRQFYVCRAAEAWQLTPNRYAAVWIDAGDEGVDMYEEQVLAVQRFQLLCAALAARPVPSVERPRPDQEDEND